MRTLPFALLLQLLPLMPPLPAQSEPDRTTSLRMPWVFADHMVLQRDRPAPVFGTVAPGTEVRVAFGDWEVATRGDASGNWRVDLPAQRTSGIGRPLVVASGDVELRFVDVLVGEVWLCAGQSNMDFPLVRARGGKRAAAATRTRPELRLCNRTGSPGGGARRLDADALARITPDTYYRGTWQIASPTTAADFSAVGFFFGTELFDALRVPIGLIDVSIGGSTTEGWVSRSRLATDPTLSPLLDDYLATHLSHPFIRERTQLQLGDWVAAGRPEPRPRHFFEPGFLFEAAIQPLAPFSLRGAIWYQGESNAHLPSVADRLFRMLVDEWRASFARPDLPIHFVQLPGMGRPDWPAFRDVQAGWRNLANVGMAVAIDVGHPTDVHPTDKRPVGQRLARLALARDYGRDVAAEGPTPKAVRRRGRALEIAFDHAAGLGWARGRGASGFEVSGDDRRFYPAHAELRGHAVVLSSPEVEAPVAARYAWAPFPEWSLTNAAGLPAAPFRTHRWQPVRIACIGDSITAGPGLDQRDRYPAQLQRLLGDGYRVANFGHSGTCVVQSTMRGDWARAFRRNPEHQDAMAFRPDVVVSNLGINDIMAWSTSGRAFVDDYLRLIDDYRALPSQPKVMLWSPIAPLFAGQRYFGSPHEREIHRAIARVATKARTSTLDLNGPLRARADWFPDHIHPDPRGAAAMAVAVHDGLVRDRLAKDRRRTIRLYVLTGQSNSLGTTADPTAKDPSPGKHPADERIRFFWSNRSTRSGDGPAVLLGDSNGRFTSLQVQQGEGRNRTFWGPEFGFARALFEAGERDFAVVKASRGGGGNTFWSKGSADDHMYRHVVETVANAVAELPPGTAVETAALLYVQGESDNPAEAMSAGKRLRELARNLRRDLPNANRMRVLVGGIAASGANRDRVRNEQAEAAAQDDAIRYFSNLDLAGQLYDSLHFDRAAKLTIGRRFAAAWTALGGPSPKHR